LSQLPSGHQRLEGPDLEALLARVRSDFGDDATIVEANRVRRGGVGGFFAKESYEVVVDPGAEDLDLPAATSAFDADDDEEPFVPFSLDQLAARIDDPVPDFSATMAAAVQEVTQEPAWPATAAIADVAPVVAATPKVARLVHGGLDGLDLPPRPPSPAAPAAPVPIGDRDLEALARLGVPVERLALPLRTDEPATVALVRLLEQLPAPPPMPQGQGAVLAVVGLRTEARALAAVLAGRTGGGADDVVVVGRGRGVELRTVEEAEERRRAWRRRKRPTLVVVDAPFSIDPDTWAAEVLAALEPVVALGQVDAGRKPEDVRAWADGLGGLDALAVDGLDATTTPAAVLGAGIPVALLDRQAATPARWAALLTDRLAALAA